MESSRIYLRAFESDDYKISYKWRNDQEIWNMLGGPQYYVSETYEKKWVEDAIFNVKDIRLAICLKENNQYIGNVYLTNIDWINRSGESHIFIGNKEYWGKGYAKETLETFLKFVFNERGLNRVTAYVLESNIASLKMHQKVGYIKEGLMRDAIYKNGDYQNLIILSILKSEF